MFFFQAEDGIRDLVRSRGLGDVYKRQEICVVADDERVRSLIEPEGVSLRVVVGDTTSKTPVSYTHLTLPTSDLV